MRLSDEILSFYQKLLDYYGEQHWWPCKTGERWEIVAGTILTQNTAWSNVEKALDTLSSIGIFSANDVINACDDVLKEAIRPAGYFNQKCQYLRNLAEFFLLHESDLTKWPPRFARNALLSIKGIGPETADSILLYAFNRPCFVIDTYTRRVASRHLNLSPTLAYNELQSIFMNSLPQDVHLYNEYHALLVKFCKDSCLKKSCGDVCENFFSNK